MHRSSSNCSRQVVVCAAGRSSSRMLCAPRETSQLGLSRGRNAMGIWQDLVDSYRFAGATKREAFRAQTARGAIAGSAGDHALVLFACADSSWQLIAKYLTGVLSAKLLCSGAVVCIMLKHCARVTQRSGGSRVVAVLSSPQARSGNRYQEAT